jgi:hypothetical protein
MRSPDDFRISSELTRNRLREAPPFRITYARVATWLVALSATAALAARQRGADADDASLVVGAARPFLPRASAETYADADVQAGLLGSRCSSSPARRVSVSTTFGRFLRMGSGRAGGVPIGNA